MSVALYVDRTTYELIITHWVEINVDVIIKLLYYYNQLILIVG